ncbi:MAG: hypothetical protein KF895_06970 [Parvibaculum sp.]|nr:hypothetical protein [Parvibaculum sp.]
MQSGLRRAAGRHLFPVMLIFGILAGSLPSDARVRIATGADLHAACSALAEHALDPGRPMPKEARYCKQYLAGYFETLRHRHEAHDLNGIHGPVSRDPYACLNIDGPRSFGQLAAQIVRTGDWNPALLEGEPQALAHKAFSDRPPCS